MRKWILFFVFIAVMASPLWAQTETMTDQLFGDFEVYPPPEKTIPPGMEEIKAHDGFKMLVPKGAKLWKVGSHIRVEDTKAYMARMFEEMIKRIKAIEEEIAILKEDSVRRQDYKQKIEEDAARFMKLEAKLMALEKKLNTLTGEKK